MFALAESEQNRRVQGRALGGCGDLHTPRWGPLRLPSPDSLGKDKRPSALAGLQFQSWRVGQEAAVAQEFEASLAALGWEHLEPQKQNSASAAARSSGSSWPLPT